jgi:hypothetical protein
MEISVNNIKLADDTGITYCLAYTKKNIMFSVYFYSILARQLRRKEFRSSVKYGV